MKKYDTYYVTVHVALLFKQHSFFHQTIVSVHTCVWIGSNRQISC